MKGNAEMPGENNYENLAVQAIRAMSEELIEVEKSISRLRQRLSTIVECSEQRKECDALSRLTHPTSANAELQKPVLAVVSAPSLVTEPESKCDGSSLMSALEDNDHHHADGSEPNDVAIGLDEDAENTEDANAYETSSEFCNDTQSDLTDAEQETSSQAELSDPKPIVHHADLVTDEEGSSYDAAAEDCEKACSALLEDEPTALRSLEGVGSAEAISRVFGGPMMAEPDDGEGTVVGPPDTEAGHTEEPVDDALSVSTDVTSAKAFDKADSALPAALTDDEDVASSDKALDVDSDDLVWETCDGSISPKETVAASDIEAPEAVDEEVCKDTESSEADDISAELVACVKDDEAIAFTEAVSGASKDDIIEEQPAKDAGATCSTTDDNDDTSDTDDKDATDADVAELIASIPASRPQAPSRSWAHIAAVAVAFAMVAAAAATSPELRAFAFQL